MGQLYPTIGHLKRSEELGAGLGGVGLGLGESFLGEKTRNFCVCLQVYCKFASSELEYQGLMVLLGWTLNPQLSLAFEMKRLGSLRNV